MMTALERPTVLTPAVQAAILRSLALGCFLRTACESAGLGYGTFANWRRRWAQDDPAAQRFDAFFRAVERAIAEGEIHALAAVLTGGPDWQAPAWFLSRRFPQRWGRSRRTSSTIPGGVKIGEMTPAELDEYERALEVR